MPAQRKYPVELRERAVKAILEIREREGKGHGEIARVYSGRIYGDDFPAQDTALTGEWVADHAAAFTGR